MLMLVHLNRARQQNTTRCTKLWEQADSHFRGEPLFHHQLALTMGGHNLPERVGSTNLKLPSFNGGIDDIDWEAVNCPPIARDQILPPSIRTVVLAGGDLESCLFNAFNSIVLDRSQRHLPVGIIIPFPLVYREKPGDLVEYAFMQANAYHMALRELLGSRALDCFSMNIDGEPIPEMVECGRLARDTMCDQDQSQTQLCEKAVRFHWFTTLDAMLSSEFFPGLKTPDVERILADML